MIEKKQSDDTPAKTIKDSEACNGTVERSATAHSPTREGAENDALAAAQAAATRACRAKKCSGSSHCAYVEEKSSGSSEPLNPAVGQNRFSATMTTSGKCQCE